MLAPPPDTVLGAAVRRVVDWWVVEDLHGNRTYCLVRTDDGRQVTLLRTAEGWHPTIVTEAAA